MLGSILGLIFSGGMTGIFGGIAQGILGYFNKKQDYKFQIDMVKAETEAMKEEWNQRARIAQIEGETATNVSADEAFAAGFKSLPKRYSNENLLTSTQNWFFVILDLIRGIMRPGMTGYLCVLATLMYLDSQETLEGMGLVDMPIEQALGVYTMLVETILYLFSTCVSWWFFNRYKGPVPGGK